MKYYKTSTEIKSIDWMNVETKRDVINSLINDFENNHDEFLKEFTKMDILEIVNCCLYCDKNLYLKKDLEKLWYELEENEIDFTIEEILNHAYFEFDSII